MGRGSLWGSSVFKIKGLFADNSVQKVTKLLQKVLPCIGFEQNFKIR